MHTIPPRKLLPQLFIITIRPVTWHVNHSIHQSNSNQGLPDLRSGVLILHFLRVVCLGGWHVAVICYPARDRPQDRGAPEVKEKPEI